MNQNPRILAIISYPFLPATTGGEISTLNILAYLSLSSEMTVFTVEPYQQEYATGKARFILDFGMPFKSSRYWNFFTFLKVRRKLIQENYDYVFFDQPWLGWWLMLFKLTTRKRIFIRSNNIEYLRFKSMGKWFWQILYIYEKWTYRMADLVLFVSDVDQKKAIYEFDLAPQHTLLTPYGVELDGHPQVDTNISANTLRKRHHIAEEKSILLFFATLSYPPNSEAVSYILQEIYPRLKQMGTPFHILICGKNLPEKLIQEINDKEDITYCGFVQDIETYIHGSSLMINPILSGGGIKTKAVDTLALNQMVVSTETGSEGIDPESCGINLKICKDNDWEIFCRKVMEGIAQKERNTPAAFYTKYGWKHISSNIISYLNDLTG